MTHRRPRPPPSAPAAVGAVMSEGNTPILPCIRPMLPRFVLFFFFFFFHCFLSIAVHGVTIDRPMNENDVSTGVSPPHLKHDGLLPPLCVCGGD